jgi:hypothetical protein
MSREGKESVVRHVAGRLDQDVNEVFAYAVSEGFVGKPADLPNQIRGRSCAVGQIVRLVYVVV